MTIPQSPRLANQKPAKRARKLLSVNRRLDVAPSTAFLIGPGSVAVDTVPGIRASVVAEGRIE